MFRKIIQIDESRCNGCGQCILDCAEGALEIVNGKAKVVSDVLCDGLGACLSGCPRDALTIIERKAPEFDEDAVTRRLAVRPGCVGSQAAVFEACHQVHSSDLAGMEDADGPVRHWPLKVRLSPINAPCFDNARLMVAADCAAPASAQFGRLAAGQTVLITCPKFEEQQAIREKLAQILRENRVAGLSVLHMDVPCCSPLARICQEAVRESGTDLPVQVRILGRDGQPQERLPTMDVTPGLLTTI